MTEVDGPPPASASPLLSQFTPSGQVPEESDRESQVPRRCPADTNGALPWLQHVVRLLDLVQDMRFGLRGDVILRACLRVLLIVSTPTARSRHEPERRGAEFDEFYRS